MELTKEEIREGFTKYYWNGVPFYAVAHHITQPDALDLLHDHPFSFTSFIIKGSYIEHEYEINGVGGFNFYKYERKEGTSHRVSANTIHQITELPEGECWTLILPEQKVQEPSLYKFEGNQILKKFWYEQEFKLLVV